MTPASLRQTLDQRRARSAYEAVKSAVFENGVDDQGNVVLRPRAAKYSTRASDLPIMLLKCGIGQTLAFLASKSKNLDDAEGLLIAQLSTWLADPERINVSASTGQGPNRLLEALITMDSRTWHRATEEAVAYATWLKRFADALVPDAEKVLGQDNGDQPLEPVQPVS